MRFISLHERDREIPPESVREKERETDRERERERVDSSIWLFFRRDDGSSFDFGGKDDRTENYNNK